MDSPFIAVRATRNSNNNNNVMVFGHGHANAHIFHVGDVYLPRVRSHTQLGVTMRLLWNLHVGELLRRGERKKAACLCWIWHPSVTSPLGRIPAGPQIAGFHKRILQRERRLLGWPRGSSSLVVQGKLPWPDANAVRLSGRPACGTASSICPVDAWQGTLRI